MMVFFKSADLASRLWSLLRHKLSFTFAHQRAWAVNKVPVHGIQVELTLNIIKQYGGICVPDKCPEEVYQKIPR